MSSWVAILVILEWWQCCYFCDLRNAQHVTSVWEFLGLGEICHLSKQGQCAHGACLLEEVSNFYCTQLRDEMGSFIMTVMNSDGYLRKWYKQLLNQVVHTAAGTLAWGSSRGQHVGGCVDKNGGVWGEKIIWPWLCSGKIWNMSSFLNKQVPP